MRRRILFAAIVAAGALPFSAGAQTVAITGGKVYTVSGATIDNGTVIIRDGKITAVGANVAIPDGAQRIDASGKWVTPGLVDGATVLGFTEVGAVTGTNDASAEGRDHIAAAFTVWEGLNPRSVLVSPAREDGVTTVVVHPSEGLFAGQSAVLELVDGSASDMVIRQSAAMVADLTDARGVGTASRGEMLLRVREILDDARVYARRRADFERAQTRPFAASRLDLEALQPVLAGRLPLLVAVDKASDIQAALRIAKDYGIRMMVAGGAEAWMVATELAAAKVPVLTGAMNNIPSSFATLGTRQENAAMLRAAGVPVVLIGNAGGGNEQSFNVRNIRYEAGNAVAYGMKWEDALRAITLAPAEAFGVADRVGSLQAGKDGNVVVWSGDPFEFASRAEHVFVRGKEYRDVSRQDMLMERYKNLPPDYEKPISGNP
ncbi:MAG TPA: amidohydrolase family protein [Gemmatimonadaceae bacterium]|nr:amidohydrolase family protein [Gemmatimonadaceae bacterium]